MPAGTPWPDLLERVRSLRRLPPLEPTQAELEAHGQLRLPTTDRRTT